MENKKKYLVYSGIPLLLIAFVALRMSTWSTIVILKYCLLIVFGYVGTVSDIKSKILSNKLVLYMYGAWLVVMALAVIWDIDNGISLLLDSGIGFLIGGGLFMFVYLISRKGLGAGDVKFMSAVGLYMGVAYTFSVALYGTFLAGIYSLIMLATKKLTKKDAVAMAPFLYLAILLILFLV